MRLYFEDERNDDFFQVCESIRRESKTYISVSDIVKLAVLRPAKSFYLSPRACYVIIRKARHSKPKEGSKCDLYAEIYSRYLEIAKAQPAITISKIAKIISEQSAPRFYMSVPRARDIYYKLLKSPRSL